jgi:hypothetical protein
MLKKLLFWLFSRNSLYFLQLDLHFLLLNNREWMIKEAKTRGINNTTPMELVNEVFRQQFQQQFCFDFETISLWLTEAGFQKVNRVDFRCGKCQEL